MSTSSDYNALRHAAGAYARGQHIHSVSGAGREALLSHFIARPTEFVQPGSVVDSLVLDDSGSPVDFVLAFVDEERTLLLADQENSALSEIGEVANTLGLSDVSTDRLAHWGAAAVEGPRAWEVVQHLLPDDIAGLLLNEWRQVELHGADEAFLARTGTTAEYGYVLIANTASATILASLQESLRHVGGVLIGEEALRRARLEVNHPVLPEQFADITVTEAGAGWMAGIGRTDGYRGAIQHKVPSRRLIAVRSERALVEGETLSVDGIAVGRIKVTAPAVDGETGFALALIDAPFDVPSLELHAGLSAVQTVSRPAVQPASWIETIG